MKPITGLAPIFGVKPVFREKLLLEDFTATKENALADYALGDRGTVEVITHDFYDAEILQVFEELHVDRERIWNGDALLVPEPDNPYEPSSIAVYIDEFKVGRLSPEDSINYWNPITRIVASGYEAVAHLQLSAVLRRVGNENIIESHGLLSLSAPGSLFPLNQAPTQATLLPQGPSMKVLDEKDHSEYLHSIMPPSGEGRLILTLEANHAKNSEGQLIDTVEVYHDRKKVGRLSTQMSEQLAPVIRYAFEHNKLTSAWGTIRGNSIEVSLTVQALRTSDIPADWYRDLPNNVPELLPPADSYQVDTAYIPTEGENNRQSGRRKRGLVTPFPNGAGTASHQSDTTHQYPGEVTSSPELRLPLLLGVIGGLILVFGIVCVFWRPLLGVIAIVLGGSIVFMALFMGRAEENYDYELETKHE